MLLVFFGFCGLQEQQQEQQEEQEQEQEHEERKRKQGKGALIYFQLFATIIFSLSHSSCPPSLFHSKGRANANNTCKKATILIAMQQKLQTTVFSTITLCQSTNAHKQRRATWNALRGEALRPPPAPPTRLFFYGWPPAATSCSDSKTAASLTSIVTMAFSRQPTENTRKHQNSNNHHHQQQQQAPTT